MGNLKIKNGLIINGFNGPIFSMVSATSGATLTINEIKTGNTQTFALMVDGNGEVVRRKLGTGAFGEGGSGGGITVTGTTNYIQKVDNYSGLTDSTIFDNGSNVGIGLNTPTAKLHIDGNLKIGQVLSATSVSNNVLVIEGDEVKTINPNNFFSDVSATQRGFVNNIPLQELGGVDKLINGVRIGKGLTNIASNVAIGSGALSSNVAGGGNTSIGFDSGKNNTTGGDNVFIGASAGESNTNSSSVTAIGAYAGYSSKSSSYNTFIGSSAFQSASGSSIGQSVSIGAFSMYEATGTDKNVAIGVYAMRRCTSGYSNVVLGHTAMEFGTSAHSNVVLGQYAAPKITTGSSNNLVGKKAGSNLTTGSWNTIIGNSTIVSGDSNIILGNLGGITTGNGNVSIGYGFITDTDTSNNILIGNSSGKLSLRMTPDLLTTLPSQSISGITADTTGKAAITKEYLDSQIKTTQILVVGNSIVQESWNGKTIISEGNNIFTVPATLPPQFEFSFIVKKNFTLSWVITPPFIWYLENPPIPMSGSIYQTKGYFLRELETNNIHLEF